MVYAINSQLKYFLMSNLDKYDPQRSRLVLTTSYKHSQCVYLNKLLKIVPTGYWIFDHELQFE